MVDYRIPEPGCTSDLATPRRVLAIGAHPDDAEFGAGGTLAKWAADGAQVAILVMTDGSKGSWDPSMKPSDLVEARTEEQRRAGQVLGVAAVHNLAHIDGELEYSMALRAQVCLWIRRTRPDVVLSHDPWRRYLLHPDHRATGWATVDGLVAARDHLFFPEQLTAGLEHHRPETLLLWATDQPDHYEDVEGFVDQKVAALLCHSSQAGTTMDQAGTTPEATERFRREIEERTQVVGTEANLAGAESFKRITP
ncbi:MAG: PIG-L family deacetylase [Acidimicrobiia bacterium]|nr:PIG-L family deacetylase [Acidimicrobiia bacterium]